MVIAGIAAWAAPVDPFLYKPFDGERPASGFFDHRGPATHNDHRQLTAWGSLTWGRAGHFGYDWPMPVGTPVLAAADGVVIEAGDFGPVPCGGAENDRDVRVRVRHERDGRVFVTSYFHLDAVDVEPGDAVTAGQRVGRSGNTGCSSGPHLHFGVWEKVGSRGRMVDPYGWEGEGPDPLLAFRRFDALWLWVEAPLLWRSAGAPGRPPSGDVGIVGLRGVGWDDRRHPNLEVVILAARPNGPGRVDLSGWSVRDRQGNTYTFPPGTLLGRDAPLRLHTGSGVDGPRARFWGRAEGVWDDAGDCAELVDPTGATVHAHALGRRAEAPCGATWGGGEEPAAEAAGLR